ncbi:response regulator transcription factor [Candidatus Synechococcus calcipolaris G9]|uniref:Response regulator transcription factor n=1 Tax=Candidatus Synechococcus calcipolaris G9 TaxID=1497997 RepID=A0ABT6F2X6_9SYNE|nr:response regulator transcription factor [Candidatus Synechococcus calcipolaris]MDG2992198.1 response regulator transcription factor [Candidatus Synechococcus calcipolaris G9]
MLSVNNSADSLNSGEGLNTATTQVLVVEDEELIRETLVLALSEEGYDVIAATDGHQALDLINTRLLQTNLSPHSPSSLGLIILDLMLPGVSGLDLCRFIRREGCTVPILMISAKGSEIDRVVGLEIGADDYLSKPFGMRELIARCRALLRRVSGHGASTPVFRYRDLSLYPQECRVLLRGTEINLSPKEYKLLELFMSQPRRVWPREQLLDRIWGHDFIGDSKTVDVHIRWLREKVEEDPSHPAYILTVRGFGYRFG